VRTVIVDILPFGVTPRWSMAAILASGVRR
jgi:hypothetical protein